MIFSSFVIHLKLTTNPAGKIIIDRSLRQTERRGDGRRQKRKRQNAKKNRETDKDRERGEEVEEEEEEEERDSKESLAVPVAESVGGGHYLRASFGTRDRVETSGCVTGHRSRLFPGFKALIWYNLLGTLYAARRAVAFPAR